MDVRQKQRLSYDVSRESQSFVLAVFAHVISTVVLFVVESKQN